MELSKLKVNIRQFNEEEPEDSEPEEPHEEEDFSKYMENGELDVDSLINDYNENHKEDEPEETPPEDDETPPENDTSDEQPEVPGDEKRTPDQAFAEMRRRAEQSEPLAKWVSDLAAKQGFEDPQQLIDAFEQQRLAKEAEAKGVPVDVYQRLHQLEKENKEKDEQAFSQKFNHEVEQAKQKYDLDDNQLNEVFRFMGQRGFIDENGKTTLPFEDAYILANKDNMIENAKEQAKQDYLEQLKQKQSAATPHAGTGKEDSQKGDELDYSKEGIFKMLDKMDIAYD